VVGSDLYTDISNVLKLSTTLLAKYHRTLIKMTYVQCLGSVNILCLLWPGGATTRQAASTWPVAALHITGDITDGSDSGLMTDLERLCACVHMRVTVTDCVGVRQTEWQTVAV